MPLPKIKTGKKRRRIKDFIPSNARWLLADLLGIDKTFTEEDLTDRELDFLKQFVSKKYLSQEDRPDNYSANLYDTWDSEGVTPLERVKGTDSLLGLIKESYDPASSLATTLGQFGVSKDDKGNFIATDNYDFNWFSEMTENMTTADALKGIFQQLKGGNPYKAMGIIAGKLGTSEYEKAGNPVRINLGNLLNY
jgi:hypothetical protein